MGIVAYTLSQPGEKPVYLLVESSASEGNVPRRAAFAKIKEASQDFDKAMGTVRVLAQKLISTLKESGPTEVSLEFGIELGGSASIPLLTEASGKANIKVTLMWKAPE